VTPSRMLHGAGAHRRGARRVGSWDGDGYTAKCAHDGTAPHERVIVRKPRHAKGTGSIFTRPGSPYLYLGYWNGSKFIKESAKTTDREAAQALLDKRREQVRSKRHVDRAKQEKSRVEDTAA